MKFSPKSQMTHQSFKIAIDAHIQRQQNMKQPSEILTRIRSLEIINLTAYNREPEKKCRV